MAPWYPQSERSVVVRASTIIRGLAKARTRAGEMAQLEVQVLSTHIRKPGVTVHIYIPAPERQK